MPLPSPARLLATAAACLFAAAPPAAALAQEVALPAPSDDPLHVDDAKDPVLGFDRGGVAGPTDDFAGLIREAVRAQPELGEARAREAEAAADREEARAQLFPTAQLALSRTSPLARDFVGGVDTLYEQTRARPRTDATFDADQLLFDFGATSRRVDASNARRRAAASGSEGDGNDIALRAIRACADLASARALVALGRSFLDSQTTLRGGVEEQVRAGTAAEGDLPQVDAVIANARARLVGYERRLATAEAEFSALFGRPAPALIATAEPAAPAPTLDAALAEARTSPQVRQAEALALAGSEDARAAERDRLPRVSVALSAGRYYLFDDGDNYDVRAQAQLVQRLGGGLDARAHAADARAREASFRADRVRRDVLRDAEVAWREATNLQAQLGSSRDAYIANRQSRDVLLQRFRYTRGTLLNLLLASDSFLGSAEAYVLTASELKVARYTLLARTGRLLPALGIDPHTAPGSSAISFSARPQ